MNFVNSIFNFELYETYHDLEMQKLSNTSTTSDIIEKSAKINDLYFSDNYLPIDVFCQYILTHLSTKSLQRLLLTSKGCLSLLRNAHVLNHLFSDALISNHLEKAFLVLPYMPLVTQINLKTDKRDLRGMYEYTDKDCRTLLTMSPNLEYINFNECNSITDETIYELAKSCTKLAALKLNLQIDTLLTYDSVATLAKNCTRLVKFDCNIKLSNPAIGMLEEICSNLRKLRLNLFNSDLQLKKRAIQVICQKCTNLTSLGLNLSEITNEELVTIADKNQSLTKLSLYSENIEDHALIKISEIRPNIMSLSLNYCNAIKNQGIINAINYFSNLTSLEMSSASSMTGEVITAIAKNGSRLKKLNLVSIDVKSQSIETLADQCRNLEKLTLSSFYITDKVLMKIANNSNLVYLDLYSCNGFMAKGISEVAQKCIHLKDLDLGKNESITDNEIQPIAQHCHELVTLDLRETSVTEEGLKALIKGCRNLEYVCIMDCDKITKADADKLKKEYPSLNIDDNREYPESMSEDDPGSDNDLMVDDDYQI